MHTWRDRLDAALGRRSGLGFAADAAFRLFDGEGDGVRGVYIDVFAGRWLVQTLAPALPGGLAEELACRGVAWWWKRLDQTDKEAPVPRSGAALEDPFFIVENGLRFEISFRSGYSQGLFLDQRDNRRLVRERSAPGLRVLNLFAYTGGFSVAAAAAGAITTTVDLSGTYLDWARRNFAHNGLDAAAHYFIRGDAMDWLGAFAKKQRLFDGIVLDPPTFSRVKGRGVWRAESDYQTLAGAAVHVLQPDGWLFASTNCRTLSARRFADQLHECFAAAGRRGRVELGAMPPDFTGEKYLLNAWCR